MKNTKQKILVIALSLSGVFVPNNALLAQANGTSATAKVDAVKSVGTAKDIFPSQTIDKQTTMAASVPENAEITLAKQIFENRDCVLAFQIFQKYAAQGNVEAQAWLGRCYTNGFGTIKNDEKAYEFFAKAAAKNNPWGINGMGVCYQYGLGTQVDKQKSMECYQKAADMGHPLATFNLARNYANKKGGFYDLKQAEKYYKKAIELNAPGAVSFYASFLYGQKKYNEAIPLFEKSIDVPESRYSLAECYLNGFGVAIDVSKAIELIMNGTVDFSSEKWAARVCYEAGQEDSVKQGKLTDFARKCFAFAAQHGNVDAQFFYANIIAKDEPENCEYYLRQAADGGKPEAMLQLGKNLCEKKDFDQALKYLILATLHEMTEAEAVEKISYIYHVELKLPKKAYCWDERGMMLYSSFCSDRIAFKELSKNNDQSFAHGVVTFAKGKYFNNEYEIKVLNRILKDEYDRLRDLADHGNPDALFALGLIGVSEKNNHPNIAIGLELLEKAAKLKSAGAYEYLGRIYLDGKIVQKDVKKAAEYFLKGAELDDVNSTIFLLELYIRNSEFKDVKNEDFKKVFDIAMKMELMQYAYDYGRFMEYRMKDSKEAERLYRLGAKNKDTRAMMRLSDIFKEKNENESFEFLRQAYVLHDPYAECLMGDFSFQEEPRAAFVNYLKAYVDGDEVVASERLAECWLNGHGCEADLNSFWKFADIAYKNGNIYICELLGNIYREGKICARDLQRAKAYYEEGIKRGSKNCEKALSTMK